MYADTRQAMDRHRDLLNRALREQQARRLRDLRRARRRAARAERRLVKAQSHVLRMRSELVEGP